MFELSDTLWTPQRSCLEELLYELQEGSDWVCLYSPTGSGKTVMSMELFRWAKSIGVGGNFYVNRKLLIGQTHRHMVDAGLETGVRAAEYDDLYYEDLDFQVTSAPTENARVFKSDRWDMHHVGEGGLVVIDEAHLQKSQVMKKVIDWYRTQGARVVLLTATPVDMRGWCEKLIVSAKLSAWRDCGALVAIEPTTISQPDLKRVKRNATGEFVMDGKKRRQYAQHIVGDVIEHYERLNGEVNGAPAFMYAPCVDSSRWLVRQFGERGHRFIHVDATSATIDGDKHGMTRTVWEDILGQVNDGKCKGLSSRFKLREGIDVPAAAHCIFATPVGALASYLQAIGRVMRSHVASGKTKAVLQDHGGVYHMHGSPNMDRPWETLWQLREHAASSLHMDRIREREEREPIRCPDCGAERRSGSKCWKCGYESPQGERRVMQEDGSMKTVKGELVRKPRRQTRHNTQRLWTNMYYGYKNKKVDQSFLQMEAFFYREHGYKPERNLPFMPRQTIHWYAKVHEVPMSDLTGRHKEQVTDRPSAEKMKGQKEMFT